MMMMMMMMMMTMMIMMCRYYISVRGHREFSTPFASICRFLISPEVSITPPFMTLRSRLRLHTFLDAWSYVRTYSPRQYRSFFWMVVVENWAYLKSTGASVVLRYAQETRETIPSLETPYGSGTYVVEQEAGCFVVKDIYLSAYSMYMFGVIVQSGPPPLPLQPYGSPLALAYISSLYTSDEGVVTCRQVRPSCCAPRKRDMRLLLASNLARV